MLCGVLGGCQVLALLEVQAAFRPILAGLCAVNTGAQVAGVTLPLDGKYRLRGHLETWCLGLADGLHAMGTLAGGALVLPHCAAHHSPCPEALSHTQGQLWVPR